MHHFEGHVDVLLGVRVRDEVEHDVGGLDDALDRIVIVVADVEFAEIDPVVGEQIGDLLGVDVDDREEIAFV